MNTVKKYIAESKLIKKLFEISGKESILSAQWPVKLSFH